MISKRKNWIWLGFILAAVMCAGITSLSLYHQDSVKQSLYDVHHGSGIYAVESLDKLVRQGTVGFDELSEYAVDQNISDSIRKSSVSKLSEYGAASFPVLIEVLASTDLSDGNSRELASSAIYELRLNNGITDEAIPIVFNSYITLPPWDESFRPAGLEDSDIMGMGGWYGCCQDSLMEESWYALLKLEEKAIPFLTEASDGENRVSANAASTLIREIKTGRINQDHELWLHLVKRDLEENK